MEKNILEMSTFGLISRLIKQGKRFASIEKQWVTNELSTTLSDNLPWLVVLCAGLVLACLGGLCLLVTLILVLNIWFLPWASALIVSLGLLLIGMILGLSGALKVKKGIKKPKDCLAQIGKDMKWMK
ncbi:MAG: phage holin family protein [Thermodesulfobacteriota bacterium]|nr:phage holin family protein [Thermodesulfobacteriota bacterium]